MADIIVPSGAHIQPYLDGANDDDRILLSEGIYSEANIRLWKRLKIYGSKDPSGNLTTMISSSNASIYKNPIINGGYNCCFYRGWNEDSFVGSDTWDDFGIYDLRMEHNIDDGFYGVVAFWLRGFTLDNVDISSQGSYSWSAGECNNFMAGGGVVQQKENRKIRLRNSRFYNLGSIGLLFAQVNGARVENCWTLGGGHVTTVNIELHSRLDQGLLTDLIIRDCTINKTTGLAAGMRIQGGATYVKVYNNTFVTHKTGDYGIVLSRILVGPDPYEWTEPSQVDIFGNSFYLGDPYSYGIGQLDHPDNQLQDVSTIWCKGNTMIKNGRPYRNYSQKGGEYAMKAGVHNWTQPQTQSSTRVDVYIPKSELPVGQTPSGALASLRYGGEAHYFIATYDPGWSDLGSDPMRLNFNLEGIWVPEMNRRAYLWQGGNYYLHYLVW